MTMWASLKCLAGWHEGIWGAPHSVKTEATDADGRLLGTLSHDVQDRICIICRAVSRRKLI